jgi:hypothetical protein
MLNANTLLEGDVKSGADLIKENFDLKKIAEANDKSIVELQKLIFSLKSQLETKRPPEAF